MNLRFWQWFRRLSVSDIVDSLGPMSVAWRQGQARISKPEWPNA
jgi:hypothetical protein